MSYILESLRKSDKERQSGKTESHFFIPSETVCAETKTYFSARILLTLLCITIISLIITWFFIARQDSTAPSLTMDEATPLTKEKATVLPIESESIIVNTRPDPEVIRSDVVLPEDNVTTTLYSQAESIPDEEVTSLYQLKDSANKPDAPSIISSVAVPVVASNKTKENNVVANQKELSIEKIPTIFELDRLMQKSIPAIDYGAHIYATDNVSGFVILNGAKRKMGEKLRSGIYIERVNRDEVILSYRGLVFSLPAMKSWIP